MSTVASSISVRTLAIAAMLSGPAALAVPGLGGCAPASNVGSEAPVASVSPSSAETATLAPPVPSTTATVAPTATATATAAPTTTASTLIETPQEVRPPGPFEAPQCSGAQSPCGQGPGGRCCGAGERCCAGGARGNYVCWSGKDGCPRWP